MNRLWFPPLPLAALLVILASVSVLWVWCAKAIAQPLDDFDPNPESENASSPSKGVLDDAPLHSASTLTLDNERSTDELTASQDRFVLHPASQPLFNVQELNVRGEKGGGGDTVNSETPYLQYGPQQWSYRPFAFIPSPPSGDGGEEYDLEDSDYWRSNHLVFLEDQYAATEALGQHPIELGEVTFLDTVATDDTPVEGGQQQPVASAVNPQDAAEDNDIPVASHDSPHVDPELGVLRLRPLSAVESGLPSSAAAFDPELGVLRLRPLTPDDSVAPMAQEPFVFLQGYLSFFNGNNLLARTDPLSDTTLQSGVRLRAVPRLGPRTFFVGSAGSSLLKYADHGEFDYNELDFSVGLYHWLTPQTYVDLNWRNQQLFAENGGDRFLNDHQLRFAIGRSDYLTPDLKLNAAYQLQSSWSNPEERSRLINRLTVGLSHPVSPQLDASLSYQLALIDFTQQDRYDSYHQLLAQLQFALSDEATLTVFGGGRVGDSSHALIDFDSTLLGLSLVMNFSLF